MKSIKCPHCGLVNFAESTSCKRCAQSLEYTSPQSFVNNKLTDEKTLKSIQSKQYAIYGIGGLILFVLSIALYSIIEDLMIMAVSLFGIFALGFIFLWFLASLVESKTLKGEKLNYKITTSQKVGTFFATLFFSYFVAINGGIGLILAPFMVIFLNGALYLYEYQMKQRANT